MSLAFSIQEITAFMLVVFRTGGILFSTPVFGGNAVPIAVKAGLSLWIAFSYFHLIDVARLPMPGDIFGLTFALVNEVLIGLAIGLMAQVITAAIQLGGHVLGMHMGLSIANVFDPTSDVSTSILGAMMNVTTVLLLLTMDFHLILLRVIAESYTIVPPFGITMRLETVDVLIRMGGYVFLFAVQVVAPLLAALFFVEVIIAVTAKAARQFNMLMLQFPLKIAIGLLFFGIVIKGLPEAVSVMLRTVLDGMHQLLQSVGP